MKHSKTEVNYIERLIIYQYMQLLTINITDSSELQVNCDLCSPSRRTFKQYLSIVIFDDSLYNR